MMSTRTAQAANTDTELGERVRTSRARAPQNQDGESVAVGNAPPQSRWLLAAAVAGWCLWVGFLVVMALSVRQSTGH